MSKISTLSRAGTIGLALGMGLLALPLVPTTGIAYAEGECTGPTTSSELRTALDAQNPGTITLCANISSRGGFELDGRRTATIDLNGFNLTKSTAGGTILSTDGRNASLTVIGDGMVDGGLSGRLSIKGGSYNRNPSNYVTSPNKAYQLGQGGRWIIDVVLDDFAATPATKAVRVDTSYTIVDNLATLGSKSGITYESADETVATVSEAGVVTGVAEGTTTITVTPTYDPSVAKTLKVSVYNIVADPEDDEAATVAAETLKEVIDNGGLPKNPKEESEATAAAKEVFGEGSEYRHAHEAIRTAMGAGEKITTSVEVDDTYEPTEQEVALVELALQAAGHEVTNDVTYFDVSVMVRDVEGMPLAPMHKLNNRIFVALMATEDPEQGYTRQYFVVTIHNGIPRVLTQGEDFYIENGVLYLITDEFSTFAVTYEDTLIPEETKVTVKAPETGATTTEGTSASSASANVATAIAAAVATVALAGAAVVAKRK